MTTKERAMFDANYEMVSQGFKNLLLLAFEYLDSSELPAFPAAQPSGLPEVKGLMTIQEIAKYLKVGTRAIHKWIKEKNFPFRRVGKDLRFDRSEVDEWTKQHRDAIAKPKLQMVKSACS